MLGEPRIPNALAKGSWTPLVQRPATVTVVVDVVALSVPSIVGVAQADVALVVYTAGLSASLDGVPRVTTQPEPTLDR
jgi:hypothetical protein